MVGPGDLDDYLKAEVETEAAKYGHVERVVIHQCREEAGEAVVVKVFILFQSAAEAQVAQTALHGRWFAGRMIKAAFYDEQLFLAGDYASTCLSATSTD
ncbi:uncharacterized protein ACA1_215710 [Acanthamoeba castellanii str. Neff]|uniref:RNA recognition motif domain-containing protein n=1 Tax=Acanthamoeba castellanii (strain ATCC 30010 / Neff) TaxID=1257118 RepID=L8GPM3_ACACF|nr:uncharacterized protein ACA1_215710 [Acanthamoeba castellanii str. Neff]ELR15099.1 hypothetical protein ACA1_215710 [Acanthamoeba castellanii str. Neff]